MQRKLIWLAAVVAAGALVWGLNGQQTVEAADHFDPPELADPADPAADIADFYAWHTDTATTFVLTLDGAKAPAADQAGTYDRDVLYGIHVDTDGDNAADTDMWIRFGQDGTGAWGVQAMNVPGSAAAIEGAVEGTLTDGNASVFVGLRDDPFFFDLEGFQATVSSGDLAFDADRDSIAGTNATAIVIEVSNTDLLGDSDTDFQTWATTARIGS